MKANHCKSLFSRVAPIFAMTVWLTSGTAWAVALVYEPFLVQTTGSLNGQATSGIGLAGNWSTGENSLYIDDGGLSYGVLETAGDKHTSFYNRRNNNYANLDSSLADAGLLDDGRILWFSVLHRLAPTNHVDASTGLGLGSSLMTYGTPPLVNTGGKGVGFWLRYGDELHAAVWTGSGIATNTMVDLAPTGAEFGRTVLIVGKVTWGVDSNAVDTVDLYLPDLKGNPGPVVSTASTTITQSGIDTLGFIGGITGSNESQDFDEIRVGATYKDVFPGIPPPGTLIKLR
jgi:hypothetical protein